MNAPFRWGNQQASALKQIDRWLNDENRAPIFRLFGYAGAGKTSMAKHIAASIDGVTSFCSYTGKAARVMQRYGCEGASTIHSLIYKPVIDPVTLQVIDFALNWQDSPLLDADLCVVDECSMADEKIGLDLLKFNVPLLVLGDPMQLPAIKGEGFFTNVEPDVMLTEIHRQALENPIIYIATEIRKGNRLPIGRYGSSRVTRKSQDYLGFSQVIAGRNVTRHAINTDMRRLRGYSQQSPFFPVVGEKLVGLKNNRANGLLNGTLWETLTVDVRDSKVAMTLKEIDGLDMVINAVVPAECFTERGRDLDPREMWDKYGKAAPDRMDFGDCLTAHKMQGSQSPSILVVDESYCFREYATNWLYTSTTRAVDDVTIMV